MAMATTDNTDQTELQVFVPETLRPGVYSNVTNTSANKNEVTINFIFANQADNPQGTLVSRVTMSRTHALEFAKSLQEVVHTINEVEG